MYIWVSLSIDGERWSAPIKFLVDTGSSGVLLPGRLAADLALNLKVIDIEEISFANGSSENEIVCLLHGLKIKEFPSGTIATFRNVPVSINANATQGLIGLSVLRHFVLTTEAMQITRLALSQKT